MDNGDCYMGDHRWGGTSQCLHCPARLRCECGAYVREDNLEAHFAKCRVVSQALPSAKGSGSKGRLAAKESEGANSNE